MMNSYAIFKLISHQLFLKYRQAQDDGWLWEPVTLGKILKFVRVWTCSWLLYGAQNWTWQGRGRITTVCEYLYLSTSYGKAASVQNAVSGCRKTGLLPLDMSLFQDSVRVHISFSLSLCLVAGTAAASCQHRDFNDIPSFAQPHMQLKVCYRTTDQLLLHDTGLVISQTASEWVSSFLTAHQHNQAIQFIVLDQMDLKY